MIGQIVLIQETRLTVYTGLPQKSKPLPNKQKIVGLLKPINEIRFIRQIKV